MKAKKTLCVACNPAFALCENAVIARIYYVKMRVLVCISCVKTRVNNRVYTPLPTIRRAFTRAFTRFPLRIPTP